MPHSNLAKAARTLGATQDRLANIHSIHDARVTRQPWALLAIVLAAVLWTLIIVLAA